jgi:hypothetical protein
MKLGQGDYQYEVVDNWAQLPEGWDFSLASDAAIDSRGRMLLGCDCHSEQGRFDPSRRPTLG